MARTVDLHRLLLRALLLTRRHTGNILRHGRGLDRFGKHWPGAKKSNKGDKGCNAVKDAVWSGQLGHDSLKKDKNVQFLVV
jgi:hypothetical protein